MEFDLPPYEALCAYFRRYSFLGLLFDFHLPQRLDAVLNCFDEPSQAYLRALSSAQIVDILRKDAAAVERLPESLRAFVESSFGLSFSSFSAELKFDFSPYSREDYQPKRQLPANKNVQIAAVCALARKLQPLNIIDAGSGVGRLSLALACLKVPVLGIDWQEDLILTARRNALKENISNCSFAVQKIDPSTALPPHDLLVALHACSDFGADLCGLFQEHLIAVPCCYQSMRRFPRHVDCISFASQGARRSFLNLACGDLTLAANLTAEQIDDIVLRRARRGSIQPILDYAQKTCQIAEEQCIASRSRVPADCYEEYARQQLQRLQNRAQNGVENKAENKTKGAQLSFEEITGSTPLEHWDSFKRSHLQAYRIQFLLATLAGRVVELLCVTDRVMALRGRQARTKTLLLWPPSVSPRNICIVASVGSDASESRCLFE